MMTWATGDAAERVAQVLEPAQVVHQVAELGERERLLGVRARPWRVGMDLDDEPVGPRRGTGDGHRPDQRPMAGGMGRVDDHRQVGPLPEHRHRGQVERVPGGGVEAPDAPLAHHDVGIARREDVLGGHEPFLDGRGQAALEEHRQPAATDRLEQHEVLHVPGADLEHVDVVLEHGHVGGVGDLGHDGQPDLVPDLREQLQSLDLRVPGRRMGSCGA